MNAGTDDGRTNEKGGATARRRTQPAITDIRVAAIETTPMTAEDYDDAVNALAVLIAKHERRRNQKQKDTDDDHEHEAPPLS